jgi:hypothetical protein
MFRCGGCSPVGGLVPPPRPHRHDSGAPAADRLLAASRRATAHQQGTRASSLFELPALITSTSKSLRRLYVESEK